MSETFDPYRKWLGIPPEEQPANFYRLLGLAVFERDADVISHAADRQMAHVRTFASGRFGALSQKLLNELSTARVCLLDATKKGQYDAMLKGLGFGAPSGVANSPVRQTPTQPNQPRPTPSPALPQHFQAHPETVPVQQPVAPQFRGALPFDPDEVSPSRPASAPSGRVIVRAKKKSSAMIPLMIAGIVLVGILVGVAVVMHNSNKTDLTKVATNNSPAVPAVATNKKGIDKEPDKDKDKDQKDKVNTTTANPAETLTKSADATTEKSTDKTADKTAEKKSDKLAARTPDASATTKKLDQGKTPDLSVRIPPIPKTVEGEMPDFGPLTPAAGDDAGLDLSVMALPSAASVKLVVTEMKAEWKDALAKATTREDKIRLAQKLMTQGATAKGNLPKQYALLKAAYGLAVEAADAETFLMAADTICQNFAVDPWETKAKAFQNAGGSAATPEDLLSLVPACEKVLSAAISAEKFTAATHVARAGSVLAARAKSPEAVKKFEKLAVEATTVVSEQKTAEKAQQMLFERRSDPKANLTYGSYLCFVRGDWLKGPIYLQKGDDEDIRRAAELELSNPFAAEKHRELGDAWLEIGKKFAGLKQSEILKHAKFWYDRALPSLSDEDKTKVEAKLAELRELQGA